MNALHFTSPRKTKLQKLKNNGCAAEDPVEGLQPEVWFRLFFYSSIYRIFFNYNFFLYQEMYFQ